MKGILKSGRHSALSTVSAPVEQGEDVTDLIGLMWSIMTEKRGAGLAANQLGETKRVIVVHANGFRQEFINPVIIKAYGGRTLNREGCLSYPGMVVKVMRHKQIIVEGFDRNWKPVRRKLKGFAAYCVQHEVDHLNGITIV